MSKKSALFWATAATLLTGNVSSALTNLATSDHRAKWIIPAVVVGATAVGTGLFAHKLQEGPVDDSTPIAESAASSGDRTLVQTAGRDIRHMTGVPPWLLPIVLVVVGLLVVALVLLLPGRSDQPAATPTGIGNREQIGTTSAPPVPRQSPGPQPSSSASAGPSVSATGPRASAPASRTSPRAAGPELGTGRSAVIGTWTGVYRCSAPARVTLTINPTGTGDGLQAVFDYRPHPDNTTGTRESGRFPMTGYFRNDLLTLEADGSWLVEPSPSGSDSKPVDIVDGVLTPGDATTLTGDIRDELDRCGGITVSRS